MKLAKKSKRQSNNDNGLRQASSSPLSPFPFVSVHIHYLFVLLFIVVITVPRPVVSLVLVVLLFGLILTAFGLRLSNAELIP